MKLFPASATLLALFALSLWGSILTARAQISYTTVPLTAASFTADVIANGAAASPPASSATADVDGAGYYFFSQDYYTSATPHTSGLPTNGAIANSIAGMAALTYQLAAFSANNSLRLVPGSTGTVVFVTPTAATEAYVLATSGSGIATVDITVTYSDGTTTVFASQTYPDWFTTSATQNVFGASGRASAAFPISATAATNTVPFLNQVKLTIPAAKVTTPISRLSFVTAPSSGGVLNVLAVSVGIPPPNCSTPPTSPQTVASTTAAGGTALSSACASTAIYLSVTGASDRSGYTYQWQASTTSATTGFATITGATGSTYTATGQTVATYYRALVGCQFAGTGSTPAAATAVQVAQNALTACYCTPTYVNGGATDNVVRVQLGTLDNPTTGNVSPYYRNYSTQQTGTGATLQIPSLSQGSTATATLNLGSDGNQYSAIWLDFNQDGNFSNIEYFSLTTNAGSSGTVVIPIVVPATAALGVTVMRVRGGDDNRLAAGNACGASNSVWGEAEDYLVRIAAPLPVELTAFTATATTLNTVRLNWATASEKNSAAFEVEYSANGTSFTDVGMVPAAGNSTARRVYEFVAAPSPATSRTVYYRLRQVDLDGTFTYSPVRTVKFETKGLALYPNPAHHSAILTGAGAEQPVEVVDAQGRVVLTTQADEAGAAQLMGLAPGIYLVRAGKTTARLGVE